jgi:hypothetical protein
LDRALSPGRIKDLIADRDPDDVRRALATVRAARPADVLAFFRRALGERVGAEPVPERRAIAPLNPITEEPY